MTKCSTKFSMVIEKMELLDNNIKPKCSCGILEKECSNL